MSDAICKGAWEIGNNCGRCSRCIETAEQGVATIYELQERLAKFTRRVAGDNIEAVLRERPADIIADDIRAVIAEGNALLREAALQRIIVEIDLDKCATVNGAPQYRMKLTRLSKVL